MSRYTLYCTFVIALAIVISSCGEVEKPLPEAPVDINIISGPQQGEVIDYPSPTFQWEGSNKLVNEFSYRLVPHPVYQEWSQWSSDVSAYFENLHEENYTFEIKGRYEAGKEIAAPIQRHFSVDIPFDLILMVQSDKSVYSLGESAGLTVTLRNISPRDISMCFLHLPGYRIFARNERTGYETITEPQAGIPSHVFFTLGPQEENVYSSSWNLREVGLYSGALVPPGDYQLRAEMIDCGMYVIHVSSYPTSITIVDR